jgi:hypothetical protein
MAKTRKNKVLSEHFIRSKLTTKNYDTYLDKTFYFGEDPFKLPADDDWDPKTGSCAMHALFTIEALGKRITEQIKGYKGFHEVTVKSIENILSKLDTGHLVEFTHSYRNKSLMESLPRNNLYDSHDFIFVKGGNKYILSQGFQFEYKHSLTSYTREQVEKMLKDILINLCDYENKKFWKDLDLSYYKKYFKADLLVGKIDQLKVDSNKRVNGIILEYLII